MEFYTLSDAIENGWEDKFTEIMSVHNSKCSHCKQEATHIALALPLIEMTSERIKNLPRGIFRPACQKCIGYLLSFFLLPEDAILRKKAVG